MNVPIHRAFRVLTLLSTLAVLALGTGVTHAKSMKKQDFVELLDHTDSIVVGTVTEKTDGFQGGLPYTEITLQVGQSIKGDHGKTYTFRQFGLIEPRRTGDGRVNLMVTPAGWPTYAEGERVMLFLHEPASETGFQTTAGLTQGKFSIRGSQIANGIGNEALFSGVRISQQLSPEWQELVSQPGGPYKAEAFLEFVRTAVEQDWIANGVISHED
jgi:hypothetical protein